ncbi:MAG: hypothetical protein KAQ88_05565, partial [Hyphomicrobiaceae bacterium]|nr:hypothetical protein [Hyphomicrobiaceae bacterium]
AEIRRNASEGFWALVLDKDDNIVGIVEHGRGTIDGTSVYPSTYAGAVHTIPGAAKVWMAHNHPSGILDASDADRRITNRISKLLDGSGVEVVGHVLLGGSRTKFTLMDKSGNTIRTEQPITPAPRNKKVKVFTRKLVGKQEGVTVRSPAEMQAVLARMGNPEGVLMLNNRHIVLGFMSMTAEEMKTLKGTGGSGRVIRAMAEMNAAAFVVSTKTAAPAAANNMAAFAAYSDWRMLDGIYTDTNGVVRSMAQEGALAPPSTFYQTEEGTTVPGLHSGVMVAAQTMPRNSGTVEEMINLLKKQPGVSQVQKPLVDEDGEPVLNKKGKQVIETTYPELDWLLLEEYFTERGGTVTQDELIAFIRQNGIKIVETMYGGEHVPTPELTTDLVDLDEVYERYNLDPDSRFDDGEIIFSSFDFHSQRSYEIIYDPQMGTAGVTGDEGKTWLPVAEPGPFLMRQAGQDQQRAAIMSAEAAIELDIITLEKGKFAGTSQWAGGSQVLDGGKFDREILLRTPKVKTGGVEFSGNLVGPSLGIDLTEQEFNHIKDSVYLNANINDRTTISRIDNDSGNLIGVTFDNLLPEDYQDFADEMSNLGIRMTDEQNNIQQVRSRIHEGEGDPILERQIENFDGSHWEEPNVFAWIRVSTRIGANGEKILFIEELQSDIHQRGSRVGYREPIPQIPKFKIEKRGEFWVPVAEDGGVLKYNGRIIPPTRDQKAGADEATNLQEAKLRTENILAQMHSSLERDQVDKLPQLPFKGNAWVTLAIKR